MASLMERKTRLSPRPPSCVLSSRTEGPPLVIIESLAMETPVVATDCSAAVREFLKDGEYGAHIEHF